MLLLANRGHGRGHNVGLDVAIGLLEKLKVMLVRYTVLSGT